MHRRAFGAACIAALAAPQAACATARAGTSWATFKAAYVKPDGRVVDTGNAGISHSEGQGFAMLGAEAAADRKTFDLLWRWTDRTLSRPDVRLFRWKYDPSASPPTTDPNNATDGELLIAWALMRGARRWRQPAYEQASAAIRAAVASRMVVEIGGRLALSPGLEGFSGDGWRTYNPSYFLLPALQDFARAEPAGVWTRTIADGLVLADLVRFGASALPPDWARLDATGKASLDPTRPPRFGFDALRAPLYLVWGGRADHPQVDAARRFWAGAGAKPPAWVDLVSGQTAPYPLSPGGQALATVVGGGRPQPSTHPDYYSAALGLIAELAASEAGRKAM